ERGLPWSTDDAIVAAGASTGRRGRPTERSSIELRLDGSGERFAPGTRRGDTAPPGARRANGGAGVDASAQIAATTLAASARGDAWIDSSTDGPTTGEVRPTG